MGVSCVDGPHAALHAEPPAWVRYVVAQVEPRALVAEPDAPAVEQVVLRAAVAEPDAPVVAQAGLPEPDALVVAQGGPPAAWAGLWFRVWARCVWAAAVPPVRSDALAVRAAYGLAAYGPAAHGLAPRLGVRAHWALQRAHLAARHVSHQASRPVWRPVGWGVPAHWALRLVWEAALRVLRVAWRVPARLAFLRLAGPAAWRVADAPRRGRDGLLHARRGLPR
jgi:hypothetical protein